MKAVECVMCSRVGAEGPLFIADLGTSRVYFNEDQFFPGWVFVVLKRHAVELYDLDARSRASLIEEVNRVAQALAKVYRPVKMNYELLGNQVPHLHWHLSPRYADDPDALKPVGLTLDRAERDAGLASPSREQRSGCGI